MKNKLLSPLILAIGALLVFGGIRVFASVSAGDMHSSGQADGGAQVFGIGAAVRLPAQVETPSATPVPSVTATGAVTPSVVPSATQLTPGSREIEFTGKVISMAADEWVVDDKTVKVDPKTEIEAAIGVGDQVKVEALLQMDGSYLAREIELAHTIKMTPGVTKTPKPSQTPGVHKELEFSGKVISISADQWVIGDKTVLVDARTEIEGSPVVGDLVKVEAELLASGSWRAEEIEKVKTGTPAASKTPAATKTPGSPKEIEFAGKIVSMSGPVWVVGPRSITVNEKTEVEGRPAVGDTVKVEAVVQPDGTYLAKEIDVLRPEFSATHPATKTSQPGMREIRITGQLEQLGSGFGMVAGQKFTVTEKTNLEKDLKVGDAVMVITLQKPDGSYEAREIKRLK